MHERTITLTEFQAALATRLVEAGTVRDVSEAVEAGLQLLLDREAEREAARAELRAMLDEAEASGVTGRTPQEILAAALERLRPT